MPSRSFAIQRAVLNAAAELYPLSARYGKLVETLRVADYASYSPDQLSRSLLGAAVLTEYRDYVKEYGHPEADDTAYDGHSLRI